MKLSHWLASRGLFALFPSDPSLPEQDLWRAVLDNAVRDLASNNEENKLEALFWFLNRDENYDAVCEAAGFTPGFVSKIFDEKLYHMAIINVDISILKK